MVNGEALALRTTTVELILLFNRQSSGECRLNGRAGVGAYAIRCHSAYGLFADRSLGVNVIATSSLLLTGFRHEWLRWSSAAVAFLDCWPWPPSVVRAQVQCPNPVPLAIPPPNLTAPAATLVPDDACVPTTVPGNGNPIAYFDDYSWKAFIALVWPALNGQRGTPDPSQPLGAAGAPLVFETFKADWETSSRAALTRRPGASSPSAARLARMSSPAISS